MPFRNGSRRTAPGKVTGFLGPNGAGKSTTMRMTLGLDAPSAGEVRIDGKAYADLRYPLREVGALRDALPAESLHTGTEVTAIDDLDADVIIGADGIHSGLRKQLWPRSTPRRSTAAARPSAA